jgi:hypothetical protein
VKDHERDELFSRARAEVTPTDDDRRRVRAALTRKLGVAAAASVGATATKAAASVTPATVTATVGLPLVAIAKASAVVVAAVVVGLATLPPPPPASHSPAPRPPADVAPLATQAAAPRMPGATSTPAPRAPASLLPSEPVLPAPLPREQAKLAPTAPPPPATVRRDLYASATGEAYERPGNPSPAGLPTRESATAAATDGNDEVLLITEMQVALRGGDTARVKDLVREHELRFPTSALAPERDGALVLARCSGALPVEAKRLGQEFIDAHPRSPLAARVRVTCGLLEGAR